MSLREQLIDELTKIDKPNEFEKIIKDNVNCLCDLSVEDLTKINMMRKKSRKLCSSNPYSKSVITEMVEGAEIGLQSSISELYNMFNAVEYIFEKSKENNIKCRLP